jgi:hypothetical protein
LAIGDQENTLNPDEPEILAVTAPCAIQLHTGPSAASIAWIRAAAAPPARIARSQLGNSLP